MEEVDFNTDPRHMAAVLGQAAEELRQATRLLLHEESDYIGFIEGAGTGDSPVVGEGSTAATNPPKLAAKPKPRL